MSLLREMPVKPVADLVGCHDIKLWHVLHHYVKIARESTSTEDVGVVGIDETSARAGQDYISLLIDLDIPWVVFAAQGRDAATVERYHVIQQLTKAVDDMHRDEAKFRPELRSTRYAWLKRSENLTSRQPGLRRSHIYARCLSFDAFFDQPLAKPRPIWRCGPELPRAHQELCVHRG